MFISLKSDVTLESFRVYFINRENKSVIDETFNKLYNQNEMQ